MGRLRLSVIGALCLTGCQSPHAGPAVDLNALPSGGGLVSFDRESPTGARLVRRPTWQAGDRFSYRRGNLIDLHLRVEFIDDERYGLLDEDTGAVLVLDADLGLLGEGALGTGGVWSDERYAVRVHPVDPAFSWPLWAGKRWTGQFLRVLPGGQVVPFVAEYQALAWEDVTTPSGPVEALKIQRTVRIAQEGQYVERTALSWFAPVIGAEVQRLEDGLLTLLTDWQRQSVSDSSQP